MSKKAELLALAERVEASRAYDLQLSIDLVRLKIEGLAGNALDSIDAVEALRETLLPGSAAFVEVIPHRPCWCGIRIGDNDENEAYAPNEARARLAAVLRAYADGVE
jgi:hypothetical protein